MDAGMGAPSSYHVAPRIGSELVTSNMNSPVGGGGPYIERKKRGRPRKYKPDESSSRVFSSVHMSSSAPTAAGKSYMEVEKMAVARTVGNERKQKSKIGSENLDDWLDCSTGSSFLPHVITIKAGEDISAKIMEFAHQGPRAVCIVSGRGSVMNVTLRHPNSSGGNVTYEGLFEIVSLCGSFTPMELVGTKFSRSGTMTITVSGAEGRVMGGLIAGLTTAATPVKVVVTSFLLSSPNEVKLKRQFMEERGMKKLQGCNYSDSESPPANWTGTEKSRKSSGSDINISLHG